MDAAGFSNVSNDTWLLLGVCWWVGGRGARGMGMYVPWGCNLVKLCC